MCHILTQFYPVKMYNNKMLRTKKTNVCVFVIDVIMGKAIQIIRCRRVTSCKKQQIFTTFLRPVIPASGGGGVKNGSEEMVKGVTFHHYIHT